MENTRIHLNRRALLGAAMIGAVACQNDAAFAQASAPETGEAVVHVPAHDIPMPASASPQARAYLSSLAGTSGPFASINTNAEAARSADALRPSIANVNRMLAAMQAPQAAAARASVETHTMNGVTVYIASRDEAPAAEKRKAHLHIHGGAFIYGAGEMTMYRAQTQARAYGGAVISVDYRMPPDHPYPAAPNDCLAAYRAVIERFRPSRVLVSGDSAGGNLAAVLMHQARDAGLPAPGALFLNTPVTDFAALGDSRSVNVYADVVLRGGATSVVDIYVADNDPSHPYLSPLRGDVSRGFPPTYLRTGTRDLLLSDTVRMHAALRKAGVEADLYVGEGFPHGGFGLDAPEQVDAEADLVRWLARHWRN